VLKIDSHKMHSLLSNAHITETPCIYCSMAPISTALLQQRPTQRLQLACPERQYPRNSSTARSAVTAQQQLSISQLLQGQSSNTTAAATRLGWLDAKCR
jgi:hypothetical protein